MTGIMRSVPWAVVLSLLLAATPALAQSPIGDNDGGGGAFSAGSLVEPIVMSVVFTLIGLLLFGACLWLIVKIAPFSIRKEIEEDQNVALGVIIGSMILGIAMILSAALLG